MSALDAHMNAILMYIAAVPAMLRMLKLYSGNGELVLFLVSRLGTEMNRPHPVAAKALKNCK